MQNTRIMFLRDNQYRPVGCVAISVDKRNRMIKYQYSVLNPADRFDRSVARHLALGRLVEKPHSISYARGSDLSMHDISTMVMKDLLKSHAPSRALKAAKSWLYYNSYEDGFNTIMTVNL